MLPIYRHRKIVTAQLVMGGNVRIPTKQKQRNISHDVGCKSEMYSHEMDMSNEKKGSQVRASRHSKIKASRAGKRKREYNKSQTCKRYLRVEMETPPDFDMPCGSETWEQNIRRGRRITLCEPVCMEIKNETLEIGSDQGVIWHQCL